MCSTNAHGRPRSATPAACFLNLVSLVRFPPGAPLLSCIWALSCVLPPAETLSEGQNADILPTRRPATIGYSPTQDDTDRPKPEESRYVTEMTRRIAALPLLEPALNEDYVAVKADTYEWPLVTSQA